MHWRFRGQITYLPGNHDDVLRHSTNLRFGPITFAESAEHHCADGTTYPVIHGDQYDVILSNARWLGAIGDWVASCTAVVEYHGGALEVVQWLDKASPVADHVQVPLFLPLNPLISRT